MEKENCYRLLPHVLRARAYRLYLADGRRLVDLWLNGGAAILGHTPRNLLREIKNTASRGLYAPLPHFTENRFLKALSKLLPGYSFRIYAAPPEGLIAELWHPYAGAGNSVAGDCYKQLSTSENYSQQNFQHSPLLIPVIPGIQTWRGKLPMGLCVVAGKSENDLVQLPESDMLSPILLATATRGIYDIIATPERAKPRFLRIAKALKNSIWQRNGIYLSLKHEPTPEEWEKLFNRFMEVGFLLPPYPCFPVILPGELSDGEEKKLAEVLGPIL